MTRREHLVVWGIAYGAGLFVGCAALTVTWSWSWVAVGAGVFGMALAPFVLGGVFWAVGFAERRGWLS